MFSRAFSILKLLLFFTLLAYPYAVRAANLADEKEFLRQTLHSLGVSDESFDTLWADEERQQRPLPADLAAFAREKSWPPRLLQKIDFILNALSTGKAVTRKEHLSLVKHLCVQTLGMETAGPVVAVPTERDADADAEATRAAKRKRSAQDAEEKARDDQLLQFVKATEREYGKLPSWVGLTSDERRTFKFLCYQIRPHYQAFWIRQILTPDQAAVVRSWVREIQPLRWRLINRPEDFLGRNGFTLLANTYFKGNRPRARKAAMRALTPDEYLEMRWDDKYSRKRIAMIKDRFVRAKGAPLPYSGNLGFLIYISEFTEGDPFAAKQQVKAALTAQDLITLGWPANDSDHNYCHVRCELKWRRMLLSNAARGSGGLQNMAEELVYRSKRAGARLYPRVSRLAHTVLTPEEYLKLEWPDSIEHDEKTEIRERFFPDGTTKINAAYTGSMGLARYALEFHEGDHLTAQLQAASSLTEAERLQLSWPKPGPGTMPLVVALRTELIGPDGLITPRYLGAGGFTAIPGRFSRRGKAYVDQLLREALTPEELIALKWPDFLSADQAERMRNLALVDGKMNPLYLGVPGLARYALEFTEGDPDGARRQVLHQFGVKHLESLKWPKAPSGYDSMHQLIVIRRTLLDATGLPRAGTQKLAGLQATSRELRPRYLKMSVANLAALAKQVVSAEEYRLLQWPDSLEEDASAQMERRLFPTADSPSPYAGKGGMARYTREFTQGDLTSAALQIKAGLAADKIALLNWPTEKLDIDEVRLYGRILGEILGDDHQPKKECFGLEGLAALRKVVKGNTPLPLVELAQILLRPDQYALLEWPHSLTVAQLGPVLRGMFSGSENLAQYGGELGLARFAIDFTAGDPDSPREQATLHLTDAQRAKLNWPERPTSFGRERVKFMIITRRQVVLAEGSINPVYRGEAGRDALIGKQEKVGELKRRTEGIVTALSEAETIALQWPEILSQPDLFAIRKELLRGIDDGSYSEVRGLVRYAAAFTGGNVRNALYRAKAALTADNQNKLKWPELNDDAVQAVDALAALRRLLVDDAGRVRATYRGKTGMTKLLALAVVGLATTEAGLKEQALLILVAAEYLSLRWDETEAAALGAGVSPATDGLPLPPPKTNVRARFFSEGKLNAIYCGSAGAARYALEFTDGDFGRASKEAKQCLSGAELVQLAWPPPPMVQVIYVRRELIVTKDQSLSPEYIGRGGLEKLTLKRYGHSKIREMDVLSERAERALTPEEFERLNWEKPAGEVEIAGFLERLLVDGQPRAKYVGTPGLARYAIEWTDGDPGRARNQAMASFDAGLAKMRWPAKSIRFLDRLDFLVEARRKLLSPVQTPLAKYRGADGWLVFSKEESIRNWRRDRHVFRQRAYEALTPVEYALLDWGIPDGDEGGESEGEEAETCYHRLDRSMAENGRR